ncbi:ribosomal RNA small subunit methyltransferase A [Candidatus Saccharibacteria bacterium]|nr:ribosomal RNA small subunit methyltransferase A [Candidatus Saccharibacteria bacterium]
MSDVIAKKSLGQHWLNDLSALDAICDEADLRESDTVLEIGPGKGSLTSVIMSKGCDVFAIEVDEDAIKYLHKIFARQWDVNLHVEKSDIRSFDFRRLPKDYKIVANIPYYLTSHLIQLISESKNPPKLAVLLVQKEVADRVCAEPGDMSILSLTSQFFWEVKKGRIVGAELFDPPPKVDSQVLVLNRRKELAYDVDTKKFFRIIKCGFSSKRKTLLNSLSGGLRIGKKETESIISESNIDPNSRPQELSLDDWSRLYISVSNSKIL